MKGLQERTVCVFKEHCETGWLLMKFSLFDHLCEDLGSLEV